MVWRKMTTFPKNGKPVIVKYKKLDGTEHKQISWQHESGTFSGMCIIVDGDVMVPNGDPLGWREIKTEFIENL